MVENSEFKERVGIDFYKEILLTYGYYHILDIDTNTSNNS